MALSPNPKTVLIVSSHALFGKGLQSLLKTRWGNRFDVIDVVESAQFAIQVIEKKKPDLVIVDYDDEAVNRDEFLTQFVAGESNIRVVLLSLKAGKEAIVYDRFTSYAADIEEWLLNE